jgi:hypothetical protein
MANTTNFGWETPDDTDLVKDGAAAIRTLGSAIDTSLVDLKGGTTGQVLSKATGTDMDFTWVTSDDANAIQNAIVDAKGDIVAASADDTPARLAVGTDNQRLVAASGEATGLKYVADTQNTVIDAAGDLVYGTAADTLGRLAIGTAGQVLQVNSGATAPEWAAPAAGGGALTYITQTDFTTQSSQAFDNVFTSTYDTYLVILENITGSVATADLQLQMRYGGTTATADYYQVIYGSSYSISVMTVSNASTVSQITLADSVGNLAPSGQLAQFYFRRVGISGKPIFMGQLASNYNLESKTITGFQDTTQTYDGFLLKPDSGNISGNVKIYGIKDS